MAPGTYPAVIDLNLEQRHTALVNKRTSIRRFILLLACFTSLGLVWKALSSINSLAARHSSRPVVPSSANPDEPTSPGDSMAAGSVKSAKAAGFAGVLTYHNDEARIGANVHESILTPSNVNAADFGKLFTVPVDGDVYAQPLYLPKVNIPSQGTHNVIYAATENNSIYAIDADDPKGLVLWHAQLGPSLGFNDLPVGTCTVIVPRVGITGTPVIDSSTNTLYVVSRIFDHAKHEYKLHALDVSTGKERPGSPVLLSASVPGKGDGSANGKISFDPTLQLQRPGLALFGGKLYIAFGSTCDLGNYHGWILAYDAVTLTQTGAYVTTPNASRGGIWQSGAAPAVGSDGSVYVVTGDGTFNALTGGSDYGDSFLKLTLDPGGRWRVLDYFTPFDQERLDTLNDDLGSSGAVLLPDQTGPHPHLLLSAAKNGTIYLLDRDAMGHTRRENNDQIVQMLQGALPKIDSTAAYWGGEAGQWIYISGVGGPLQQYSLAEGRLSSRPVSHSDELFGYPGSTPSISSDGKTNGIVWVVGTAQPDTRTVVGAYFHRIVQSFRDLVHEPRIFFRKVVVRIKLLFHSPSIFWGSLKKLLPRRTPEALNRPAILRAYDAGDVSNLLYDSTEAPQNRDQADLPVKFVVPTIANGKVFFGTQGHLDVYGLLNKQN